LKTRIICDAGKFTVENIVSGVHLHEYTHIKQIIKSKIMITTQ